MPVVCAMSGNFVQRGNPSCMDKSVRAKAAIDGGADVVLEIPFPYSSMTAEKFARAGVTILTKCGMCSHLLFGAETADVDKLTSVAKLLLTEECQESIQVYQKESKNISYARAREMYVEKQLGDEYAGILSNPNDILGVEYIKAIIETGSSLVPVALKRSVNRKDEMQGVFASSSKIREFAENAEWDKAAEFVPNGDVLNEYLNREDFYRNLHLSLMTKKPEELKSICEVSDGLEYAIIKAAKVSDGYDDMVEKLKTKTVTDAKIRRMLLFSFLGVTKEYMTKDVPYTFVLGMSDSEKSKELMRMCRKEKTFTVAQKMGAVKNDSFSEKVFDICMTAEKVLNLSSGKVR